LHRWIVWRPYQDDKGRWLKVPVDIAGRNATGLLANHCRSFDEAVRQAQAMGYGIGFVPGLISEGVYLAGLDFDRVLNQAGERYHWVDATVRALNSYAEVSPSGTGIRVFFLWVGDPFDPRNSLPIEGDSTVEAWHSTRFMTVTGNRIGSADVVDCTAAFTELYRRFFIFGPHHRAEETRIIAELRAELGYTSLPTDVGTVRTALSKLSTYRLRDYHDWLRVGMALHSEGDDAYLELWDEASRRCPDVYDEGCCEKKWATFGGMHRSDDENLHLASVYYWALEDSSWRPNGLIGSVGDLAETIREMFGTKPIAVYQAPQPRPANFPWQPLLPLIGPPNACDVTFPTDALPPWLKSWVEAVAEAYQVPVDLPAMLSFAVIAGGIARRVRVRVRPDWEEPTNIYAVVALPTGDRKSAVLERAVAPVHAAERAETERLSSAVLQSKARLDALESKKKKLVKALATVNESGRRAQLEAQIVEVCDEIAAHKLVVAPRFCCDDATPEALAGLLIQHGKMFQCGAEGTPFELAKGRYGNKNTHNYDVYLKGHTGDPLIVDRVGRQHEHVEKPALTMGLAVQPDVLRGLTEVASMDPRGYLSRFLYVIPRSRLGSREVQPAGVPEGVSAEYEDRVRVIWCDQVTGTLELSPEANAAVADFQRWVEPQLIGELTDLGGWPNKLVGAAVRIAASLHTADGRSLTDPVDEPTIGRAIRLARGYLLPHARCTFDAIRVDAKTEAALAIVRVLPDIATVSNDMHIVARREIHRKLQRKFRKASDMDSAIDLLIAHGYLVPTVPGQRHGRGHASPMFHVHPDCFIVPHR
jgi:hypothetical protein